MRGLDTHRQAVEAWQFSSGLASPAQGYLAALVQYRTDKGGIVQCTIGRASFGEDALKENLLALVDALNKAKPAASKGVYLKKIAISSTMGAGVRAWAICRVLSSTTLRWVFWVL